MIVLIIFVYLHVGGNYSELSCKFTENGCHENFRGNGPVQGTMESGNIKLRCAHYNGILYTGIKQNRKWFWLANRNSNCNQATKETAAATTTAELDWPIRSWNRNMSMVLNRKAHKQHTTPYIILFFTFEKSDCKEQSHQLLLLSSGKTQPIL